MKAATPELDRNAQDRIREAAEWRMIALLLERPRDRWWSEVADLALNVQDPALVEAAAAAADAREGTYLAWAGTGGRVSLREAGHRASADPAHVLAEIESYYAAFAYQPAREDPCDHLAVEAGFVSYLKLKEAYAIARGSAEEADVTHKAAEQFIARHIACMAEPVANALSEDPDSHLARAARALFARVGSKPRTLEGGWVPEGLDPPDCSMVCGVGQEPSDGEPPWPAV